MKIEHRETHTIKPYPNNPRQCDEAIDAVAASIKAFGFRQPIVIDSKGVIVAGHTRWQAAKGLGLKKVPVHVATDLTAKQVKAYRVADNKLHELGTWDDAALRTELESLNAAGLSLSVLGFSEDELTRLLSTKIAPHLEAMDVRPCPTMYWALIGIPLTDAHKIADQVDALAAMPETTVEVTANDDDRQD